MSSNSDLFVILYDDDSPLLYVCYIPGYLVVAIMLQETEFSFVQNLVCHFRVLCYQSINLQKWYLNHCCGLYLQILGEMVTNNNSAKVIIRLRSWFDLQIHSNLVPGYNSGRIINQIYF